MKDKITIKIPMKSKKPMPKNPKVGVSESHYLWLEELSLETAKTCTELNNLFYDYIRNNIEITIERKVEKITGKKGKPRND